METSAKLRYARYSPLKMRKIARGIKKEYGYSVVDAINVLQLEPSKGAKLLSKLIKSALANAIQKNMKEEDLRIKTISVDEGPGLKRMKPLSMGRATIIKRRTSHVEVVLTDGK
ncbi:50S ribosomal protein L22 [bacterium]|nr:50S ribosomal protein L22 [bacterium]MCK5398704.1 50S ribosomal protein L22 [bacterium]